MRSTDTENSSQTTLSHVERPSGVALFEAAKLALSAALADAKRIDEVMGVRVRVEQMALHARQAKDRDLIADAMELQLTAERRLGEMLIVARETGQMSQGGRPRKGETPADREGVLDKATLAEAGVTYRLSVKAQKLAAFDDDRFADVLQAARDKIKSTGAVVINPLKDLNTADKKVKRAVREATLAANQKALPDKKFGVILADPEWDFETWSEAGKDRSAENHYPVSSDAVIAARPVGELAAPDCVLWLWTPCNRIHRALAVMAAWGFEYKSLVVWDKFSFGTGFWFRDRAEILLVGTRGNVPAPAMGEQWENLVSSPKSLIHSDKPVWAYELIEHYFPNLPKIELNARTRRDGWDAWGFEAPDDEIESAPSGLAAGGGGVSGFGPNPNPDESLGDGTRADATEALAESANVTVVGVDGGADPLLAHDLEPAREGGSPDSRVAEADDADDAVPSPGEARQPIRSDESIDAAGGRPYASGRSLAAEPETGAGQSGAEGGGEGGCDPVLPEPSSLSSADKNDIIRAQYALDPFPGVAAIGLLTGLNPDAVKQRARTMKLGSRDRQRDAVRVLMTRINDERRAG